MGKTVRRVVTGHDKNCVAKIIMDGKANYILYPPKNGSVCRIVQFDPEDPEQMAVLDGKAAFAEM